jgi:uncharacterized protein
MKSALIRGAAGTVAAGLAALGYGVGIERHWYALRRFDVPVLPPGAAPLRVLHVSDLHLMTGENRKVAWLRQLARLEPDLLVNTGDTFTSLESMADIRRAFEPFRDALRVFVPGNNDYYAPVPKSPHHYFVRTDPSEFVRRPLPWPTLAASLTDEGWVDLTHTRVRLGPFALAGLDDPHLGFARYGRIAGPADPDALVRIGVLHSPEPRLLTRFAADGYDLALAGHTHGGQVRIPFGPAIVTNSGIDVWRARWLHRWDDHMWFHVNAGVGTNPYLPIRFGCRPEASLLTLVPRG